MAIPDPSYVLDTYALTTVDRVKHHFNIDELDTSQDALFTRYINSMTDRIENFTQRKIKKRSHVDYRSGRQNSHFLVRQWPADKPTEVWIDASSEFTDATNMLDSDEFDLEYSAAGHGISVILLGSRVFSRGTRNVKIVYEAGFTETPYQLEEATIAGVEWLLDIKEDRRVGLKSKNKNNETTSFNEDLPKFIRDMIFDFQRLEVPDLGQPIYNR